MARNLAQVISLVKAIKGKVAPEVDGIYRGHLQERPPGKDHQATARCKGGKGES